MKFGWWRRMKDVWNLEQKRYGDITESGKR